VLSDGDGFNYDRPGASPQGSQFSAIEFEEVPRYVGSSGKGREDGLWEIHGDELEKIQLCDKKNFQRLQAVWYGTLGKKGNTERKHGILCEALLFGLQIHLEVLCRELNPSILK
jgi:hypothetical protein